MLVLTRKPQQGVNIYTRDGVIHVAYLGECVKTGQARIGIEAPADMLILREELRDNGTRPQQETH